MSAIGIVSTLCSLNSAWYGFPREFAPPLTKFNTRITQQLVQAAWSVVNHYAKQSEGGILSKQQAQLAAIQVIKSPRFGQNNYFVDKRRASGWFCIHPTHIRGQGSLQLQGP
jgi:hypothetical protein